VNGRYASTEALGQNEHAMPLQILTLKLDGITAGDYLTWCRDPEPPALNFALRSISIDADPLGDTVTATLDWNEPLPPLPTVATAAGLPLAAGVQIHRLLSDESHTEPLVASAGPHPTRTPPAVDDARSADTRQRLPGRARSKVSSTQRSNTPTSNRGGPATAAPPRSPRCSSGRRRMG
jgi:hypothetical protein